MSPSPNRYHQDIVLNVAVALKDYVRQTRAGHIYVAPSDVVFTDEHVLHPDIYFVSAERASILTPQGAQGAPDLVVEILSPGTARLDLGRKREIYAESGVLEFWAVSPPGRTVEIYRFRESPSAPVQVLKGGDAVTTPLLPGFSLSLSAVFES